MQSARDEVVRQIRDAICHVVGPAWAAELEITADASLIDGIELDSIETSKVIEIMLEQYPRVDFESWFSGMNIQQIMSLTIGQIADFIVRETQRQDQRA
ncbi:MAG: hypothetical protein HYS20_06255 [Rhodocyclales bacterium]|nr:hypothetical protein [Rhodocyclales bacterium]